MENSLNTVNYQNEIGNYPIKVVALGGLDEMGKNCYIIEVNDEVFIVEAGMKYPTANMPGVDMIIPDFDYLKNVAKKVKGIIITHGHDDQYGALPYLLNVVSAPIYATKTTVNIILNQYGKKFKKVETALFKIVQPSDTITIGSFVFDLFQTSHSVSESFGFALKTKFGNIVYTSDFMSDYSSLPGFQFDLTKVSRLADKESTFLLMTESEAADKTGIAAPNHKILDKIKDEFENQSGKIFVSVYSQNFYNIQEIFNLANKYRKKICFADSNQKNFFLKMASAGSLNLYDGLIIDINDLRITASSDVVILVTGSGEKLFNLCKDICYSNVNGLQVESTDTWINASPSVPGTEAIATDASDTIFRTDCHVLTLSRKEVNSMHAQQEDLKMMISLFKPKYYLPVKGYYKLLLANARLAIDLGIGLNHFNTFVFDNGMALAFDENGKNIKKNIFIKNGDIMVDGNSVGDVKETAIEERTTMADGGIVLLGVSISSAKRQILSNVDVQMRGFLYMSDSEPVVSQIAQLTIANLNTALNNQNKLHLNDLQNKIADKVSKFILHETNKEPLVMLQILDVDAE